MATVISSAATLASIKLHIQELAEADLVAAYPTSAEVVPNLDASELINILQWRPHWEIVRLLPSEWFSAGNEDIRTVTIVTERREEAISTRSFGGSRPADHRLLLRTKVEQRDKEETVSDTTRILSVNFPASVDTRFRIPIDTMRYYGGFRSELTEQELAEMPDLPGVAQLRLQLTLKSDVDAQRAQWYAIEDQVISVVAQAKTVNRAIKLLPAVKLYLPSKIIAKLDMSSGHKGRLSEVDLSAIDHETLATVGVVAKLGVRS